MSDSLITKELIQSQAKKLHLSLKELEEAMEKEAANPEKFSKISSKYSRIQKHFNLATQFLSIKEEQEENLILQKDEEMREMAEEELLRLAEEEKLLLSQLMVILLPVSTHQNANIYLELRPAAGGDEATLFVADLARAYTRFAENSGFTAEITASQPNALGGFKELVLYLKGAGVHDLFAFEGGTHRVQRVPKTEAQGRVHTSTITVAVLPEPSEAESIALDKSQLRIDTFRASGAGGQHVNKTDSAIRVTHLPTGLTVECQDGRSQHKNKAKALALLSAKLQNIQEANAQSERASERKDQIGTGDRAERIRTYNYPQSRVSEHRIGLTLYSLEQIMDGDFLFLLSSLQTEKLKKHLGIQ